MSAATDATRTAECCRESARILDDARKGLVLGGQLPPRWPKPWKRKKTIQTVRRS
jgi:hypothetical protein